MVADYLKAWILIDGKRGVFGGRVLQSGSFNLKITAADTQGATAEAAMRLEVLGRASG